MTLLNSTLLLYCTFLDPVRPPDWETSGVSFCDGNSYVRKNYVKMSQIIWCPRKKEEVKHDRIRGAVEVKSSLTDCDSVLQRTEPFYGSGLWAAAVQHSHKTPVGKKTKQLYWSLSSSLLPCILTRFHSPRLCCLATTAPGLIFITVTVSSLAFTLFAGRWSAATDTAAHCCLLFVLQPLFPLVPGWLPPSTDCWWDASCTGAHLQHLIRSSDFPSLESLSNVHPEVISCFPVLYLQ